MAEKESRIEQDTQLVGACLSGDAAAWDRLRAGLHEPLRAILHGRGATATEAADLLGDLWSDCLVLRHGAKTGGHTSNGENGESEGRPGLLTKYHGRCALITWLAAVATHRLVDLKRRQKFVGELPAAAGRGAGGDGGGSSAAADPFGAVPAPAPDRAPADAPLLEIMRRALLTSLARRSAEERVMLRLVYLENISQRTLARMWGWNESKVSRALDAAMRHIRADTLEAIAAEDLWLELTWTDFLELCEGSAAVPWF